MPLPIENYALIGDCHTAALVGSDGSIDWLCFPRFDSGACFAALLGGPEHGRWLLAPKAQVSRVQRSYRPGTLILDTEFHTADGAIRVTDFMPLSDHRWDVVRMVEGLSGQVLVRMELIVRFDYGAIMPWVRRSGDALLLTAGPDTLELTATVPIEPENMKSVAEFTLGAGDRQSFAINYRPSHAQLLPGVDAQAVLAESEKQWRKWSDFCNDQGPWHESVLRSLITLKALTYKPTGGMVAAPTTSLPEQLGGVRNWDYRFCWLRDSTFTWMRLNCPGCPDTPVRRRCAWAMRRRDNFSSMSMARSWMPCIWRALPAWSRSRRCGISSC